MAEDRKKSVAPDGVSDGREKNTADKKDDRLMSFVEGDPRIAEVAKQARLVAEQKLAAYEYAHNYRKKLQRDKERSMTQAKLRREEERAAAKEREREEEAERIAEALAEERLEAEKRNNRASAILEEVLASRAAEEEKPATAEEELAADAPTLVAGTVDDESDTPARDTDMDMEISVGDGSGGEMKISIDDADGDEELHLLIDDLDELCEEREDEGSVTVDNPNALAKIEGGEIEEQPAQKISDNPKPSPKVNRKPKPEAENHKPKTERSEPKKRPLARTVDEQGEVEPFRVEDDIVALIKEQGAAAAEKSDFAKYIKRSNRAIKRLLKEIKKLDRRLGDTTDDALISETVVDIISKCAVILEIRCDNVSVASRLGLQRATGKLSQLLLTDIDRYNSRASAFAALTGEELTRISAFLPEHLVNRTGRAVIPKLAYREKYVEIGLDQSGVPIISEDSVATFIIAPAFTAEGLVVEAYVGTDGSATALRKAAERADRKFESEISSLERELRKNAVGATENQSRESRATQERAEAIGALNRRFSNGKIKHKKYTAKLNKINSKYEKAILKIRRQREIGDYLATEKRLTAQIVAAQRESVVSGLLLVGGMRRVAKNKFLSSAKSDLVKKLSAYNLKAKAASTVLETDVKALESALIEQAGNGKIPSIPKIASRRELVETVGDSARVIGDRIRANRHKGSVPSKKALANANLFDSDKTLEERALLREGVMLSALRKLSDGVKDKRSYKKYLKLSRKTARRLKKGLRQTKRAIFRAVEKNGVVSSLVETLRIQSKLTELRMLDLVGALRIDARTRKAENRLYREVDEYNRRALDYESISDAKLRRISPLLPEEIAKDISLATVPAISYKETYFEVYPKNNEGAKNYTAPETRQPDAYIPIDYKYRRITENRTVEVTEIAPPAYAEERLDNIVADTRHELIKTVFQTVLANMLLQRRLRRVLRRKRRNERRSKKFDRRLLGLNKTFDSKIFKLESLVPEEHRGPSYRDKVKRINEKYERQIAKLRYNRAQAAIERRELKLVAEEITIRRERVAVFERRLANVRSYGKPRPIRTAKADLIGAIREYNRHSKEFSRIIGEPVVEISAAIADDILRTGKIYKLPKTLMCREIVETNGRERRIIGDKYRYGMPVAVNAQGLAVMTGSNFIVPGVGSPYVSLRSDGQPVIGVTDTGLPYAGAPDRTLIAKARINPTEGIKAPMLAYMKPQDLKDNERRINSEMECAVSGEIDELDKFIGGALKAKSRTVSNWREYRRYIRHSRGVRKVILDIISEHRRAIKRGIRYMNDMQRRAEDFADSKALRESALRVDKAREAVELHETNKEQMLVELKGVRGFKNAKQRRAIANRLEVLEKALEADVKKYYSECRKAEALNEEGRAICDDAERAKRVLSGLYIRLLSAKGRLVELGCNDLFAASKIEISRARRALLAFSIVGRNPKKKMHTRLYEAIEDYNSYVLEDSDGRAFTPVSVMLPDLIAERSGWEEIPDLIFRERFIESDDAKEGDKLTKIDTPQMPESILKKLVVRDKSDYKEYNKLYKRAMKEIESGRDEVDGVMRRAQDKLDRIRAKKLRAGSRYQRAAHRISKKTNSVVAYQRKIRKRLNRYRRRIHILDRRERTPSISVKRWAKRYNGYNDKGLIYGLAGRVRGGAVALLNLERERLILACHRYLDMIKSEAKSEVDYRAEAKRALISAMVRYNRAAQTCSERISEPLSCVNSTLPAVILKTGEVPEIPEVVCHTVLCEAVADKRTPVT